LLRGKRLQVILRMRKHPRDLLPSDGTPSRTKWGMPRYRSARQEKGARQDKKRILGRAKKVGSACQNRDYYIEHLFLSF